MRARRFWMNNPSDSFQLDENLARLLAAYDPAMDGANAHAPTITVPKLSPLPGERPITPLPSSANEGSLNEVLPDTDPIETSHLPIAPAMPLGPHRIGRFELRRQLGKGGCGIVFLAYDPTLQREVALKIPRPELLLSPDARRRLVREALAAAEFDHPNLVPVYETGETGPVCFIATAFCPGLTLAEWLDKQAYPVPVRQAARLLATVAEAVQHAHDRGVLHRDLKPNNVILQPVKEDPIEQEPPPGSIQLRGDHFIPRVVDFGLAKLVERGGPSETTTRQIVGTPKYMAPEQAQARHDDVGPAADVYALGVILYESITGRAPYEGETDVEVLRLAINGKMIQPRHLRPDTPRDLEAICLKAMNRNPARRYRTAIDLADDLRRFLDDKPTLARPLKWPGRAARWLRRNDQAVALGVVTTIATVLFAIGWWSLDQTRQLKSDRDNVLRDRAERTRGDQQRDYARAVRSAFVAWRAGDHNAVAEYLDLAERLAQIGGEATDFPQNFIARLHQASRLMIICPAGSITTLAVSHDGKMLASGHANGSIAVWNSATGEQLGATPATGTLIKQLVFARNGTRLISADGKRAVCLTVAANGAITRTYPVADDLQSSIVSLAVLADGTDVYAGNTKGEVYRLSLTQSPSTTEAVRFGSGSAITALAMAPDSARVLAGTASGEVIACTTDLKEVIARTMVSQGVAISAILPLDEAGEQVDCGSVNGQIFALRAGQSITQSTPQLSVPIKWLARTASGLTSNATDGRVRISSAIPLTLATGDSGTVVAGVASPNREVLFTGGENGIIRSWRLPDDLQLFGVRATREVIQVGLSEDGARIAVATPGRVIDHHDSARPIEVAFPNRLPAAVSVPGSGPPVVVLLEDKAIAIRDAKAAGKQSLISLPDQATPRSAALTPDANYLVVGDDRGRVFVWAVSGRELLAKIDCGHKGPIQRVAISADGKTVAAPTPNGVSVWAVGDANPIAMVTIQQGTAFRLSSTGDILVTASHTGAVRIWSMPGGREEFVLHGHVGRITSLAISPDGRTVVSGCMNGEVIFWDRRTGQELINLRRHSQPVTVMEFSADGKTLVTAGEQIAVWRTNR